MTKKRALIFDEYWSDEGVENFEWNWERIETSGQLVDASGRRWVRRSTALRRSHVRELLRSTRTVGVFSFGRQQLVWILPADLDRRSVEIAKGCDRKDSSGRTFVGTLWVSADPWEGEHLLLFRENCQGRHG